MGVVLLGPVLLFGWPSDASATEKAFANFQDLAEAVCRAGAEEYITYSYVAPVTIWSDSNATGMLSLPKHKDFCKNLVRALDEPGVEPREAALTFVEYYAALARSCAAENGERDLEGVTYQTFAIYSKVIKAALLKALDAPQLSIRLTAAGALLAFEPQNAKANSIIAEGIRATEKDLRGRTCQLIKDLHLTTQQAVSTLILGLADQDPEVRQGAANAICVIGSDAKKAVPAIIKLMESGEDTHGRVDIAFSVPIMPQFDNLALRALSAIGTDAGLAVPLLLHRFQKAKAHEQCEILSCLAKIGHGSSEVMATLKSAMKSDETAVSLGAACAILRLVPDDQIASGLLRKELKSRETRRALAPGYLGGMAQAEVTVRRVALRILADVAPRSRSLVPTLTALLDDEDIDARELAAQCLGNIGRQAEAAIPSLERHLTKEQDGQTHTFRSHQAVASALARIGNAAAPALIRATASEAGGRAQAIDALGDLRPVAQPEVVQRLIQILGTKKDPERFRAAIALGRLGERARNARPFLQQVVSDPGMKLAASWALMRIPE